MSMDLRVALAFLTSDLTEPQRNPKRLQKARVLGKESIWVLANTGHVTQSTIGQDGVIFE